MAVILNILLTFAQFEREVAHPRNGDECCRYCIGQDRLDGSNAATNTYPMRRAPAAEIETSVMEQLRQQLLSPKVVARTWKAAQGFVRRQTN